MIDQHLYDFPPLLREHIPGIPAAVEEVVLKALAKNPRDRFGSVLEFAAALKAAFGYRTVIRKAQTRIPARRSASGKAIASQKSQPDIWSNIFSLFMFDFLASSTVGIILYELKVVPPLLWLLLSLSLVLFALVRALVMRSHALVLLVCGITIMAALPAVAFQSTLIFAVCYLVLSGLSLPAALATSIQFQSTGESS